MPYKKNIKLYFTVSPSTKIILKWEVCTVFSSDLEVKCHVPLLRLDGKHT